MTLRYVDGFDAVATADLSTQGKWVVASSPTISASGRFTPGSVVLSTTATITKIMDNQTLWVVGAAFFVPSLPGTTGLMIGIMDGATTQVSLYLDSTNKLRVYRSTSSGTLLGTSTLNFTINAWHFVELKVLISNAAGTIDVLIDGVSFLALTAQDTTQSANVFADRVQVAGPVTSTLVDDTYILDGNGLVNNNLIGDARVVTLLPSAAGNYAQWDNIGGAANYASVADAAPDGDTSYVSTSVVNELDSYTMVDLPAAVTTIRGVQAELVARKDETATRAVAPLLRISGTDYPGTAQNISSSYQSYLQVYEQNPATSAAWTAAGVNGAEFGVKLTT